MNLMVKRIAMYHGTQPEITESLLRGGLYDVGGHRSYPSVGE